MELVKYLISSSNCKPFQTNTSDHTVLDIAIIDKNSSLVHYLVNECGCDQLCKTRGMKIMNLLCDYWDEEVARCLICDGACQLTMENGTTLLHEFAKQRWLVARVSLLTIIQENNYYITNISTDRHYEDNSMQAFILEELSSRQAVISTSLFRDSWHVTLSWFGACTC